MTSSTRSRLQKARLRLSGVVVVAALGCTEAGLRPMEPGPEPARPQQQALVPGTWARYVVARGDTLGRIAACRGTSVAALAGANRISAPDHLQAGAVLRVPANDACTGPPRARNVSSRPAAAGDGAGPVLHEEVTDLLERSTARYDAADFEEALSLAQAGIGALAPYPGGAETDALRARCHILSGMATAGLGQRERAIAEFRQALAFAPDLPLDPERSSPRVLELVEAARANPAPDEATFVDSSTR